LKLSAIGLKLLAIGLKLSEPVDSPRQTGFVKKTKIPEIWRFKDGKSSSGMPFPQTGRHLFGSPA
jgi:hypothetical protein